jgi:tetratricopeptide (TPR) repeat protein
VQEKLKTLPRVGFAELKQGDLEGAHDAFERAYAIDPQPAVALSLAEVEMKLERYEEAAAHFLFLRKTAPPDSSERPSAHNNLAECRKHLGRAKITVHMAAAELFVDGRSVGFAPMRDELWLAPKAVELAVAVSRPIFVCNAA